MRKHLISMTRFLQCSSANQEHEGHEKSRTATYRRLEGRRMLDYKKSGETNTSVCLLRFVVLSVFIQKNFWLVCLLVCFLIVGLFVFCFCFCFLASNYSFSGRRHVVCSLSMKNRKRSVRTESDTFAGYCSLVHDVTDRE